MDWPPSQDRFGNKRYRPDGRWVQTTLVTSVVGIHHRKRDADQFARSVRSAEFANRRYGVIVEHEPANEHDRNAIAVYGYVEASSEDSNQIYRWKIGYLARELAAEISTDIIALGLPLAAELYDITISADGFIDVRLIVLAPPGNSHSARIDRRSKSSRA